MIFLLASVIFDMAQVFLVFVLIFSDNLSIINSSSWMAFLTVSLIGLVFFRDLSLGLRLIYISKREIVRLSLISIPMLPIILLLVFLDRHFLAL